MFAHSRLRALAVKNRIEQRSRQDAKRDATTFTIRRKIRKRERSILTTDNADHTDEGPEQEATEQTEKWPVSQKETKLTKN